MRLLLAIALILLFLWLYTAQVTSDGLHPCTGVSVSKAAASLLLSPLSLYSWLSSTLLRLLLSTPALVLGSLHHSFLLLMAWPWCIAVVCVSLLCTCLHVAVYLLHLALGFGVVAILILTRHKMADTDGGSKRASYQQQKPVATPKAGW